MRGIVAKRLRRAASKYVTAHRVRETTDLAPGGGVSYHRSGVRRIYQDSKRKTS
jgi:hypothetical protein